MTHTYCKCGQCAVAPMKEGKAPGCFDDLGVSGCLAFIVITAQRWEGIAQGGAYDFTDARADYAAARKRIGRPATPEEEWAAHLADQIERREWLVEIGRAKPREVASLDRHKALLRALEERLADRSGEDIRLAA